LGVKTGIDQVRLAAAACALLLGTMPLGTSAAGAADDASRWDGDARSAARLIAGSSPAGGTAFVRAGIEIRLKPGWHTYWRYPGDAGVPPQFDFAGSQNVKQVHVLWPAPQRLPEDGGISIGYARDVLLPLHVVAQDPNKPVTLKLKLDYAVCEKLCVPAEARNELILNGAPTSQDAALAAAEARVPKRHALGDGQTLAIRSVRREAGPERSRIVVDVASPMGTTVDLFAEGPTPQWALPLPAAVDGAPDGIKRFTFDLDGAPPGATYEGASITLTAVGEQGAIEVATHLD
jgi:DsbC/DsbD-like thiol-disulfide interchange protein